MKRKIEQFELTALLNDYTMIDYYLDRFRMLATSLFTWKNLDKYTGDGSSKFLEQSLYEQGRSCFVKDKKLGYLALKNNPSDKLNVYNLSVKVMAWTIGYNKTYNFDDIVYIMSGGILKPKIESITLFCNHLYEIERCTDVNIQ